MARDKSILTPIVLGAEGAGGAATLMAVPVSTISTTAFYRCPDVYGFCGLDITSQKGAKDIESSRNSGMGIYAPRNHLTSFYILHQRTANNR